MTTIRIDQLRNAITLTSLELSALVPHLLDLHTLAYDRHAAARSDRVRGGSVDFALDTHGDPKARALYRDLAGEVFRALAMLRDTRAAIDRYLAAGEVEVVSGRRPASVEEVHEALAAQRRREAVSGHLAEYQPARLVPQPQP